MAEQKSSLFNTVSGWATGLYHRAAAINKIGPQDSWRALRGNLSEQEAIVAKAGLSGPEAIAFIKQSPLSSEESWLIKHGATAVQARELAKQPLGALETQLIIKGVPPMIARREASAPITSEVIKASVADMVEHSTVDLPAAFDKPVQLIDELTLHHRHTGLTREQLYLAETTLSSGASISLSQGLANVVAQPHVRPVEMADTKLATSPTIRASSAGAPTVSTHSEPAVAASSQPSVAVVPKGLVVQGIPVDPSQLNATISDMLAGKKVSAGSIKKLQSDLNGIDYNCGKADGVAGAATWACVAEYASDGHFGSAKPGRTHIREAEAALKEIGYHHVEVDGKIDKESARGIGKFFRLRASTLGDFAPKDVNEPDFAALAAIQSGLSKKRGLYHGAE